MSHDYLGKTKHIFKKDLVHRKATRGDKKKGCEHFEHSGSIFCIFILFLPNLINFLIAQLPVRIVKGNGCSAPQGIVDNGERSWTGVVTIKKQKDGSAPW